MKFFKFLFFLLSFNSLAQLPAAQPRQLNRPASGPAAAPLSLQEAIAEALQHNYGIQVSRLDEQTAQNNVTRGNAGQLPSVTGNLTRTFNNNNINQRFGESAPRIVNGATSNAFNTNVTLGWTIFDGFGMFIAYDRLKSLRLQQQQITRATVEETVEDVANAYYNVVRQAGKITSLEAALKIGQARIDLTQAQVDVGVSAKVEVLTARVDYNADRSLLLQQQQALQAAKITLNNLLGRAPRTDFAPSDTLAVTRDLREETITAGIKANNPRLAQTKLGLDVAAYDRRLVRASRFPQIGLVSGYGLTRNINNAAFAGTTLTSSVNQVQGLNYGITASVPIFDGFNLRRQEQNARVVEEQRRLQLDQTGLQLDADAATAFAQYQNYLQLLDLEETNIQLARQNVEIALERYRLGLLTPLALREAQRNELDAETRLLDIRYATKQAELALRRLSGELVRE
ncbi:TolC family protein [Hymenobacter glaciei]|uniref:TolC family protein n=1 Tax=Hymenobacter glaciei TaxID=877209 RepID=A0ABP7UQG8_9BACT